MAWMHLCDMQTFSPTQRQASGHGFKDIPDAIRQTRNVRPRNIALTCKLTLLLLPDNFFGAVYLSGGAQHASACPSE